MKRLFVEIHQNPFEGLKRIIDIYNSIRPITLKFTKIPLRDWNLSDISKVLSLVLAIKLYKVEIHQNPFEGLKRKSVYILDEAGIVEIHQNPFEGLKQLCCPG